MVQPMPRIHAIDDGQIEAVADVWNRTMTADPMTPAELERRFLHDANAGPDGISVAEEDGRIVGFCIGAAYRRPAPADIDPNNDRAFVVAIGVLPEQRRRGLGRLLLDYQIARFVSDGRKTLSVAPYPLGYVIPGVDVAAYSEAIAFFRAMGFEEQSRPLAMENDLTGYTPPPEVADIEERLRLEGILIEPFHPRWTVRYLRFMQAAMPSDWHRIACRDLSEIARGQAPPGRIFLAHDQASVYGYCRHEAGRFGPFGVAPHAQGRGIGTVLLGRTLAAMRDLGERRAYLLWTSDRTARLYARLGFREFRRFAVMHKRIG